MLTLEQWAWIATIAVPAGAFLVWAGRRWEAWRRNRAERAAADAALVADVRAHLESEAGRPYLVLTNHGSVDALACRVTVDGLPLEEHQVLGAHYPKGLTDVMARGEVRCFRGAHFSMGSLVYHVRVEWTTAKGRTDSWSAGLAWPP